MTIAHRRRGKAIRREKRRLGVTRITAKDFGYLRAKWQRRVDGPPIGTLADLLVIQAK